MNEWSFSTTQREKRIKTGGCLWGELWRKAEIDGTDRRAVEWEQLMDNLSLSRHIKLIRAAFLISLQRTDVSLHLSSVWLSVRQTLQTSVVCDSCISLFSPFSSPLCPPSDKPATNVSTWFPSLVPWASYRINSLLVLIDVRATSSPWDCSGNNVWSTSQVMF